MSSLMIIEMTDEILEKTKKDNSGTYVQQIAYAYTKDSEGKKNKYPERLLEYRLNAAECLPPGLYELLPNSILVRQNSLTFGRLQLKPVVSKPVAKEPT